MAYSDFDKLKAFFFELKSTNFHPEKMRSRFPMNGAWVTIDKTECFNLLRQKIPDLKGQDDAYLIKYLSNPNNIKNRVLAEFVTGERVELEKSLEKPLPVAAAEVSGQPGGQAISAGQEIQPTGGTGSPTGGMPFGMPSAPSISPRPGRIIIHNVPQTPEPPKSEISIANSSGTIIKGPGAEAPPSKIFIADKSGTVVREHTIPPSRRFNFPGFKIPSSVKNLGSRMGVFFQKNVGKFFTVGRVATGISAGIGAITGGALTNGSAIGMLGGGGLGAVAPSWIRNGEGTRFLGRMGNGAINFGANLSNQIGNGATRLSMSSGSKKLLWGFLGAFILFFGVSLFGGLTETTPSGEASPIGGITNISSCKFTRDQENPKEASFKSNLLLSYIQEASQKSSIPPAVLAAFIRVESPSSSNMSDNQIINYSSSCAESPTGALGIMQIQPPGTTSLIGDPASCDDCIDAGAQLVGKTVSTMTRQDYCNPRTNIIVGAGWILKKMSKLGYGDGTKWDPAWTNDRKAIEALVNTYYGCLFYGGTTDCTGPYNYADDVSTSIQNCQIAATAVANLCPTTGKISVPYGFNIPDYPQEVGNEGCGNLPSCHNGVDIAANEGLLVKSTISGTVLISGSDRYKGNYVEINNPTSGLTVTFEHLATIKVAQNSSVSPGQEIGTVGRTGEGVTGPVLHYKIKRNGVLVNPFLILGTSAEIDQNTLASSDDIAQNDYSSRTPARADGYWGDCR